MDVDVAGLVPQELSGAHLLALPRTPGAARAPVDTLARAWFPDARWVTAPVASRGARKAVGARFRGVVPDDEARPGDLRLADSARAVGPFALTPTQARTLGLRDATAEAFALHVDDPGPRGAPAPVPDDRDGIVRAFPAGVPQGVELQVLGWAVAAARRLGGAVVADGRALLSPDPTSGVDLTLYGDRVLTADDAVGVLRTVVPGARAVDGGAGTEAFQVVGETPYDGAVRLAVQRVPGVPIALGDLDREEYGPYAHRISWEPQDPYELEVERPSGVHVIARSRARVLVARLAAMLHGRLAGTLVDDGGFVVRGRDLDERLMPAAVPASSSWA